MLVIRALFFVNLVKCSVELFSCGGINSNFVVEIQHIVPKTLSVEILSGMIPVVIHLNLIFCFLKILNICGQVVRVFLNP